MQGGIDPELPGTAYFDLVAAVKQRVPGMHVHAFSPMEIVNGASRTGLSIEDFLIKAREAGLDTLPGTAAEILDDDVRWVLTKGKLPTRTWIEIVTTAHRVGLPIHLDDDVRPRRQPAALGRPPAVLARIQDETGGFTEFVPLPFVHTTLADLPRRRRPPGPHPARQPRRPRRGPDPAARPDPEHPDLLGQARRRRHPRDAAGRRQRPRRHADGGDDLPDGRLRARLRQDRRGAPRDRRRHRPPAARAHHDVRRPGARVPGGPSRRVSPRARPRPRTPRSSRGTARCAARPRRAGSGRRTARASRARTTRRAAGPACAGPPRSAPGG